MFKKNLKKKLLPVTVLSSLAFSSLFSNTSPVMAEQVNNDGNEAEIKNVIFLIGDGMGISYTSAYRYLKDNPNTPFVDPTEFDKHLVGIQMTYPEDPEQNVTDSASAATAMSTGYKTYNAAIAVDNDGTELKTVLETAKEKGKATGLVATSEITHATPASFGAHDESRKNMNAIADDYYDELVNGKHKVDVMLGGGLNNFVRNDRDLTEEFKKDGYSYVTNREELLNDKNEQILGLFAPGGLPKMIDRPEETPSLEEMTNAALERLSKDEDGFFLMIEGSQVDWAGHDNDIVGAMSEMEDFEKAYKAAIEFAKRDKHTLVVATADHSTGGYSIGADGIYNWFGAPIKAAKRTPDFMANEIVNNGAQVEATLKNYLDLDLTAEEIESVKNAVEEGKADKDKGIIRVDNAIEEIINNRSHTGWTTGGHTGEDVPVYAFGPGKERFAGQRDNTDHANIIFDILENQKASTPDTSKKANDMKEGDFGFLEVQSLINKGVITVAENGNYYPNNEINRAEAAVLLQRALNLEVPTELNSFTDVTSTHPQAKEIAAVKAAGIFKGRADGSFGPNLTLSRQQMATILVNAFKLQADNDVKVTLKDIQKAGTSHQSNIRILYQNGVTAGKEDGTYGPNLVTKRVELAVFLNRLLEKK